MSGKSDKEHEKYLQILPQMGLTPEMVPADLRLQIYEKLGVSPAGKAESSGAKKPVLKDQKTLRKIEEKKAKKRQQARSEREEQTRLASIKESDLLHTADGIGGNEKISMSDILMSLDADKFAGDEATASGKTAGVAKKTETSDGTTVNTTKLRKQMKALKKEVEKAPALDKPISGRKRKVQEQKANYEINRKKLDIYIPQVQQARKEVQSDFTTADKLTDGGKVVLNSLGQMAANLESSKSGFTDQLEQQVQAELKRQGLRNESDLKKKEMDSLGSKLDSNQMNQRYLELSKLKSLLFKNEIKNRRVSKIKSKLYHKIKNRDKDREEKKLKDHLELIDPEAAAAYREKEELKKVEERLRVRHGAQSKFAKNLKRFKNMDDKETRDAYHKVIQERNALVHKTQKVQRDEENTSSEGLSDDDGSHDSDSEDDATLKQRMINKMLKEAESDSEGSDDSDKEEQSGSDDGDSDGRDIKMNFDENSKSKKKEKKQKKGILGLKFMERAQEREKQMLKSQVNLAVKQIKGEDDYAGSSGDDSSDDDKAPTKFLDSSNKFGVKALQSSASNTGKVLDADKVLKAARRVTGAIENEDSDDCEESEDLPPIHKATVSKKEEKPSKKRVGFTTVEFGEDDLKNFNADKNKLIKEKNMEVQQEDGKDAEQANMLKSLFVTQAEDAYDEFEKEKDEQIEKKIGSKFVKTTIKQGWGTWAGDGVDTAKLDVQQAKLDAIRQKKIDDIKKARQDAKLRGVQINETEERDKKFAAKYWVKDLPYQYTSAKQYDQVNSIPVGKEWNTQGSYKRMIQADVLTKAGEIIKPLKFRKDIPIQTIEKLVQHRQSKRANRSAAKF